MSISVIIPSYNYGKYLAETLDSVLSQDYPHFEIVLVDDGSTDESQKISREYATQYPKINYVQHPKNLGLFQTFLTGFQAAKGEYVHYFSADDKYLPGFLSKCMDFLLKHPQVGVVCTDLGYFKDNSSTLKVSKLLENYKNPTFFPKEEIIRIFKTTTFWVTGASCIAKRELIEKYGPHNAELENLSDWYLFHTIALKEGIGYIPEVLTTMREHDQSLTNQVKRNKKRRRSTYHHLLHLLLKNKELRRHYLEAELLNFIFRDLKWKLFLNPKYFCYWSFMHIY